MRIQRRRTLPLQVSARSPRGIVRPRPAPRRQSGVPRRPATEAPHTPKRSARNHRDLSTPASQCPFVRRCRPSLLAPSHARPPRPLVGLPLLRRYPTLPFPLSGERRAAARGARKEGRRDYPSRAFPLPRLGPVSGPQGPARGQPRMGSRVWAHTRAPPLGGRARRAGSRGGAAPPRRSIFPGKAPSPLSPSLPHAKTHDLISQSTHTVPPPPLPPPTECSSSPSPPSPSRPRPPP